MDCPRALDDLAAVPETARDEIFFSGFDRNASLAKDQRIAALDDHQIFVVVVHVRSGIGGLMASPKCHLTPIHTVINVALDSRCRLATCRDPVCGRLHELWKTFHGFYP
jgi:hypothetical protein